MCPNTVTVTVTVTPRPFPPPSFFDSNSMSATPLSNHTRPVSPLKYVFLTEWWLHNPHLPRPALCVAGVSYGQRERLFMSAAIAKRFEANLLETEDGITVQFRGFINSSRSSQNGFSSQVCEDFLLGFPDDWKKYTAHSFKDENVGCSNTMKTENMSCGNTMKTENMKTVECKCRDVAKSLKSSQPLVDMMGNGENGASDVAGVSQAENPKNGQTLKGVCEPNPCTGLSGKSMVGSPIFTKKIRRNQLSSCPKVKRHQMCKDADEASSTARVLKKGEKVTASSVGPVRRSPRLYNCRK